MLVHSQGLHDAVFGMLAGAYTLDSSTSTAGTITPIGVGCMGASQAVAGSTASATSSTLTFNLAGAIPNGAAVHLLGVTQLPVPIPLPLGNCLLRTDILLVVNLLVTPSGTATIAYPLRPTVARP